MRISEYFSHGSAKVWRIIVSLMSQTRIYIFFFPFNYYVLIFLFPPSLPPPAAIIHHFVAVAVVAAAVI
jgi:hypothetical protein